MADFQGVDFLELDSLLSDEERAARDTVREFVSKEFLPCIQEHVRRDGSFPMDLVPKLAELGLFGANLSGYGCAGMNNVAYGLVMQELERGDSGLRSFASVQGGLVMYPIHAYGSDAQKDRWLPALAEGTAIGCFGLTEPDFGSHAGGMITQAVRRGDSWLLNGTKRWITNGSVSHVALVWARTEDGIRGFLVETDRPGFEARDIKGKFSLRASITSELFLHDVEVPEASRLPGAEGLKAPLSCLTQARYGIAWGAIGSAMACYEEVVQYTRDRTVQGGPLAGKQLTQAKLADMLTEITKAQLLALRVAQLKDTGRLHHAMVSMAKRNNVDIALTVAREARDLLGANGIVDDYQAMRHMLNLETVRTYEGTHDVHTLILGKQITGLSAL
ncbi:MAG: acyl-CoA dehydrogenase family protein [Myxococcota bacterium]|nr:acyl-CoA dehydrogenase [Deltaproteobacteria bacterium]MCP4239738.1 acyl-CoA dehydrogenase [bacterium]MDP6074457.1 acyl-CoA dehydrogenase family protein [Myxococcota bacterium]MDP6241701.1 acyl-CoA dehydrogenase family protein [Myxococcota bacterium]MDP7073842.1 acyl-CoA dehydrogenase family protein [Myxococcota bacterium]